VLSVDGVEGMGYVARDLFGAPWTEVSIYVNPPPNKGPPGTIDGAIFLGPRSGLRFGQQPTLLSHFDLNFS